VDENRPSGREVKLLFGRESSLSCGILANRSADIDVNLFELRSRNCRLDRPVNTSCVRFCRLFPHRFSLYRRERLRNIPTSRVLI